MKRFVPLFLLLALLLAACQAQTAPAPEAAAPTQDETVAAEPAADTAMDDAPMEAAPMADEAMDEPMTADDEMMAEPEAAVEEAAEAPMAEPAAWQQMALTDVRSGATFTLADFAGKTVFVEPMATWCTNCRRQLGNVQTARAQLNSDDVVFVALSVETALSNDTLQRYTEDTGFDWHFAVAPPEMLQALVDTFGQSITNPPSTPHFIIRPDGTTTELSTGIESADELIARLQAAGG